METDSSYSIGNSGSWCNDLDGSGGYTQAPKPVLMCVIKQKQYPLLESSVLKIDSKAFIIVNDVHQVHGAGFTSKHVVETNETTY